MEPKELCHVCRRNADTACTVICDKCKWKIHAACSKKLAPEGDNVADDQVVCAGKCYSLPHKSVPLLETSIGSDHSTPERIKFSDQEEAGDSSDSSVILVNS